MRGGDGSSLGQRIRRRAYGPKIGVKLLGAGVHSLKYRYLRYGSVTPLKESVWRSPNYADHDLVPIGYGVCAQQR
jgi:hypothetical protein